MFTMLLSREDDLRVLNVIGMGDDDLQVQNVIYNNWDWEDDDDFTRQTTYLGGRRLALKSPI